MSFSVQKNSAKLPIPGPGQKVNQLHKAVAAGNAAGNEFSQQIAALQSQISALQIAIGNITNHLYPFKIYQLPAHLQTAAQPNDWLKIRVRAGGVTVMALPNPTNPVQIHSLINVTGTDGVVNPDVETYLDNPLVTDILVEPNDPNFFIWVTLIVDDSGNATAQLYYGDNPAAAGDASDWPTFPQMDQYHQLVGMVDSATYASIKLLGIRQIARGDMLFAIC